MWQNAGNFAGDGYRYTGALRILKVLMGYDYLWSEHPCQGRGLWMHEQFRPHRQQLHGNLQRSESESFT